MNHDARPISPFSKEAAWAGSAAESDRDGSGVKTPDLSVVIPVYNEKTRLPQTIGKVLAFLAEQPWSWEVVISDDGSADGTPELIGKMFPQCRLLRAERNRGKGAAVRRGMLAARGKLRLFSDADLSTPIGEVAGMIQALRAGNYDAVIASRALPGSRLTVRQPWWRELSGRLFNRLVQPLSGLPYHDTQCGFKLFRAEAARLVFERQRSEGWAFDVEILMLAQLFGLNVLEHPVEWINSEASKVSLLYAAPRMIGDIIIHRWRHFTGQMAAEPPKSENQSQSD